MKKLIKLNFAQKLEILRIKHSFIFVAMILVALSVAYSLMYNLYGESIIQDYLFINISKGFIFVIFYFMILYIFCEVYFEINYKIKNMKYVKSLADSFYLSR